MILSILAFIFIVFEVYKLMFPEKIWKYSKEFEKYRPLVIFEAVYMIYVIVLLFTKFWYIGAAILLLTIITSFQIYEKFMTNTKLDKQTQIYLRLDNIFTIILLANIILMTILWN